MTNDQIRKQNQELKRRYDRALRALKVAKKALNRYGWQDGPTDNEALDAIDAILHDERVEKAIAKRKKR